MPYSQSFHERPSRPPDTWLYLRLGEVPKVRVVSTLRQTHGPVVAIHCGETPSARSQSLLSDSHIEPYGKR